MIANTKLKMLMVLAIGAVGCADTPSRVLPPELNAANVGQAAVEQYDADGDGIISGDELAASPALKAALPSIDTNGDGAASAVEIAARVQNWLNSGLGVMSVPCHVRLDGKPLAGATVTLEPEAFLGDAFHPAVGISDASGMAHLTVAQEHRQTSGVSGVTVGFYKVRVSKNVGGRERITARHNIETIHGCEVALDSVELRQGLQLNLTSKP